MDKNKRDVLLQRYSQAVDAMFVAIEHIDADQLDSRPELKARSAREIVHHLADSELHQTLGLRRMLAENTPVLHHWDEQLYAERLHYERPIETSLGVFRAAALSNIELLRALKEEQWKRTGNIQRPWSFTVEDWLSEQVTAVHNRLMDVINAPHGGRAILDAR